MTIEINRPEIEAPIQQRLHSGAFQSVEDVLFDALEIQGEREAWLQENKEAITQESNTVWLNSTGAKAFQEKASAIVSMLTGRHGSPTALKSEILRRCADAEADLQRIWRYLLGEASLAVANRVQSELVDAFEDLADVPGKVIAVLHGKRDVKGLLKPRLSKSVE